jgi:hypothetical protein
MGLAYSDTTDSDFRLFIQEFEYWQKKFGLLDWEILFEKKYSKGLVASLSYNMLSRGCIVMLSSKIPSREYNKLSIMMSAFHEVCELLLSGFNTIIENSRDYLPKNIAENSEGEQHRIIMILQNSMFIDDLVKRMGLDSFNGIEQLTNVVEEYYRDRLNG